LTVSYVVVKGPPAGFAGQKTSHNSRPFVEKSQKIIYRGTVHGAANWDNEI
jgi:hypothetical protein